VDDPAAKAHKAGPIKRAAPPEEPPGRSSPRAPTKQATEVPPAAPKQATEVPPVAPKQATEVPPVAPPVSANKPALPAALPAAAENHV
jgi:hypothetical protein